MPRSSVPNERRSSLRSGNVLDWTLSPIRRDPELTSVNTEEKLIQKPVTPQHEHKNSTVPAKSQPSPGMANLSTDIMQKGLKLEQRKMSSTPNVEVQKGKRWRSEKGTFRKPAGRKLLSDKKIPTEAPDQAKTESKSKSKTCNSPKKTSVSRKPVASKSVDRVITKPQTCKKKSTCSKDDLLVVNKKVRAKPCNTSKKMSVSLNEGSPAISKRNISSITSPSLGTDPKADVSESQSPCRRSPRKSKTVALPPIDVCTLPISKDKVSDRTKKTTSIVSIHNAVEPRKSIEIVNVGETNPLTEGGSNKKERRSQKSNTNNSSNLVNKSKRKALKQSKSSSRRNPARVANVMGRNLNASAKKDDLIAHIYANQMNTDSLANYINQIEDFDKRFPEVSFVSLDLQETKISLVLDMNKQGAIKGHLPSQIAVDSATVPGSSNSLAQENGPRNIIEELQHHDLKSLLNDMIAEVEQKLRSSELVSLNKDQPVHQPSPYIDSKDQNVSMFRDKPDRKRKYSQISVSTKIKEINEEPPCKRQKLQSEVDLGGNLDKLQRTDLKQQVYPNDILTRDIKLSDCHSKNSSSVTCLQENLNRISFSTPDHSLESSEGLTSPLHVRLSKKSQSDSLQQQGKAGTNISDDGNFASEGSGVPLSEGRENRRKRKTKASLRQRKQKLTAKCQSKPPDSFEVDSCSNNKNFSELNQNIGMIPTNFEMSSDSDKFASNKPGKQTNRKVRNRKSRSKYKPQDACQNDVYQKSKLRVESPDSSTVNKQSANGTPIGINDKCETIEFGSASSIQELEISEVTKEVGKPTKLQKKTNQRGHKKVHVSKTRSDQNSCDTGNSSTKCSTDELHMDYNAIEKDLKISTDSDDSISLSLLKNKQTIQTAKTSQVSETTVFDSGVVRFDSDSDKSKILETKGNEKGAKRKTKRKEKAEKKTLKSFPDKSDDQYSSSVIHSPISQETLELNEEQKVDIENDLKVSSDSETVTLALLVSEKKQPDHVPDLSQSLESSEVNLKQKSGQKSKQDGQSSCAVDSSSASENIVPSWQNEHINQRNIQDVWSKLISGCEDASNKAEQLNSPKFVPEDKSVSCDTEGKGDNLSIASPVVSQFSSPMSVSSPFSFLGFENIFSPHTPSDIQVSETIHKYSGINFQAYVQLEKVPDKEEFSSGDMVLTKHGRENQSYWKIAGEKNLPATSKNNVDQEIPGHTVSEMSSPSHELASSNVQVESVPEKLNKNKEGRLGEVPAEEKVTENILSGGEVSGDTTCPSSSYYVCTPPKSKPTIEFVPDERKIPPLKLKRKPVKQADMLTEFELAISRPQSDSKAKKKPREAMKRSRRKSSEDSISEDVHRRDSFNAEKTEKTPVDIKKLPRFSGPLKSKIAQNILRKKAEEEEIKRRPKTFHVENPVPFLEILQSSQSAAKDSEKKLDTILLVSPKTSKLHVPTVKDSADLNPNNDLVQLEKPKDQLANTSSVSKEKVLKEFDEFMSEMNFTPLYEEDSDDEEEGSPGTIDALSSSEFSFEGTKPKMFFGVTNLQDPVVHQSSLKSEKPNFFCGLNVRNQGFLYQPVEKLSFIQGKDILEDHSKTITGNTKLDEIEMESFSMKDYEHNKYLESYREEESSVLEAQSNETQISAYVTMDEAECTNVTDFEPGKFFESYQEEDSSLLPNSSSDMLNSAYVTVDQVDCTKVSNRSSNSNDSFACLTLDEVTIEEPGIVELDSVELSIDMDKKTFEEKHLEEQEPDVLDDEAGKPSPGELETKGLSDLEEGENVSDPSRDNTPEPPEEITEQTMVDQSLNQSLPSQSKSSMRSTQVPVKKKRSWRKSRQSPEQSDSDDSEFSDFDDAVSIYAPSEASFLFDKDLFSSPETKPAGQKVSSFMKTHVSSTPKDLSKTSDRISQKDKDFTASKPSTDFPFKIPLRKSKSLLGTSPVVQEVCNTAAGFDSDQSTRDPPMIPYWACPPSFFSLPDLLPMRHCPQFLKTGACPRITRCQLIHRYVEKEKGFECAISVIKTSYRTGQLDHAMKAFNSAMIAGKPPFLDCYAILELFCNRGAVDMAMEVLQQLCGHQFFSKEFNNSLIGLFAKKKNTFREHLSKVVNATLLLNIPLYSEPLVKLLRLYTDEKDWKEFWRVIDYCKGKFPVPIEIQIRALQAVTQDPAKWLPLAKNYIESRQVEELSMISIEILKCLNEECHKAGYAGCCQILSKVNSTLCSGDPRRNPAVRSSTLGKVPQAIPLNNIGDIERVNKCLSEVMECSILRNWENLGKVFVRQCREGVDFHNPLLLKGYVDCLAKQENLSAITNSFNNFVRGALEKADHEGTRAYVDEKFLAKIGLDLMGMFYSQVAWKAAYEVVFTLHDTRLKDYMLEATDSDSRIGSIMSINICLQTGQLSFALQIIQSCLDRKVGKFLSSALTLPEFNLCFKLLKDLLSQLCTKELNGYISTVMDKILGNCPRLKEEANLHKTEEFVCLLITKLLPMNVRYAEDMFQKAILHNLTIAHPVCRALLVGCFQKGTSQMVQTIYFACKQYNIYPRQNPEDINPCLLLDVFLCAPEMKLVVEDYLYETFQILCKKQSNQGKLEDEDFELDICLISGKPRPSDLPFLSSMLPNSLQESQRTLVSILQEKLNLEAQVLKTRIVSVVPASLKTYMTSLGQYQGIRFDIPGRAPAPARGRPTTSRPPINTPLERGPGPHGDGWLPLAGPPRDLSRGRVRRGARGGHGRFNRGFRGRW